MAEVVKMPKLGFDMAEGKLIRWLVAESETIQKGQVLAEIETDKATVEVEAPAGGRVHKHLVAEDTFVPVGRPIAIIAELDESVDIEALIGQTAAEVEAAAAAEAPATEGLPLTSEEAEAEKAPAARVAASPIARRMARDGTARPCRLRRASRQRARPAQQAARGHWPPHDRRQADRAPFLCD